MINNDLKYLTSKEYGLFSSFIQGFVIFFQSLIILWRGGGGREGALLRNF